MQFWATHNFQFQTGGPHHKPCKDWELRIPKNMNNRTWFMCRRRLITNYESHLECTLPISVSCLSKCVAFSQGMIGLSRPHHLWPRKNSKGFCETGTPRYAVPYSEPETYLKEGWSHNNLFTMSLCLSVHRESSVNTLLRNHWSVYEISREGSQKVML